MLGGSLDWRKNVGFTFPVQAESGWSAGTAAQLTEGACPNYFEVWKGFLFHGESGEILLFVSGSFVLLTMRIATVGMFLLCAWAEPSWYIFGSPV
jgi:hypothetical protein